MDVSDRNSEDDTEHGFHPRGVASFFISQGRWAPPRKAVPSRKHWFPSSFGSNAVPRINDDVQTNHLRSTRRLASDATPLSIWRLTIRTASSSNQQPRPARRPNSTLADGFALAMKVQTISRRPGQNLHHSNISAAIFILAMKVSSSSETARQHPPGIPGLLEHPSRDSPALKNPEFQSLLSPVEAAATICSSGCTCFNDRSSVVSSSANASIQVKVEVMAAWEQSRRRHHSRVLSNSRGAKARDPWTRRFEANLSRPGNEHSSWSTRPRGARDIL